VSFAAHLTSSPSPIRLERVATAKAITLRIPQLKDCKNHFDKKKEKGQGHDGLHLRRPVGRRLDHELP